MKSKNWTSLLRKIKPKDIFRILLLVVLAAVVGINIYVLNATRLSGNSVPMPFGFGASVVLSGSMEPALSVGDLLIIVRQDSYEERDIIVFQDRNMAVTHRIVSIGEEEVITRGDANNTEDSPIAPSQIKGKVVLAIPLVGYLVNLIKTPVATLCIVALAVWLLERSFRADKEKDDKKLLELRLEIEKLKQEQRENK